VSASAVDRRIRGLRPAKPKVDPFTAHGWLVEQERRPNEQNVEWALTAFLAGAECPFTCSFCDLWRWTIDGPTPAGALVRQLEQVLAAVDGPLPDRLKLYNASNFFDRRAVPPEDLPRIAELALPFSAVTVESHASTIGPRTMEFARQIPGRLEVAIGLETVHPAAASRLNKRLDLSRFERASDFLRENDVDLRVFVLLGAPHVERNEALDWVVRTVEYAAARGAAVVSIIPVRGGNGELERLQGEGDFHPPTLRELEAALDRCSRVAPTVVTADVWDAERLPACEACRSRRIARLRYLNVSGAPQAPITCAACDAA
jgi:radical SAM enzyme (TIGR01210 family)